MNQCQDKHKVKYKITYKPAKGNKYCPVWLVCEQCCEKKHFGSDDYIQSAELIPSKIMT